MSTYADNENVLFKTKVMLISCAQPRNVYERASSVKVNWDNSEASLVSCFAGNICPSLPEELSFDDKD